MGSSMSDPVSNVEIEDVLSSIRRLVSSDDRSAQSEAREQSKKAAEPDPEDTSDAVDALVLTPALRVSSSEAPAPEHAEVAQPEDDVLDAEKSWEDEPQDQPEDEAVALDEIAEADEGSLQPDDWAAEAEEEADVEAGQDEADDWQDEHESEAGEALSDRVAGFEKAVAARDDEWEPDGDDSDDENAAAPTEPFSWQDEIEDAELVSPDEGLEPYVAEEDDFAPEVASAEPDPDSAEDNGFLAEDDLLGDDDPAVLDEEALRDLVTEIVRQELQGSLGERITRNVRKLVRREIHRALATKELE